MRSLLSFTVEHFLLFEASLLQYALFVTAVSSPSNLSTTSAAVTCQGCAIAGTQSILTFPGDVKEVIASQSVTVIPYVTVYEDGKNVTNYSTYSKYSSGASSQGLATGATPLTWEAYGTTLTYPTTYLAYPSVSAGASKKSGATCSASMTPVKLSPTDQAHLVFPIGSGVSNADLTKSAQSILDLLPTISAIVSPNTPADCSHGLGFQVLETNAPASTASLAAVVHTTVRFLTTQGQAVITRATGNAPPPQSQNQGGGSTPPPSSGGSNGGQGGNSNQQSTPVINWGGSTITAGPSGVFNIGGHTLTAGGAAQVIDGTTVSIAAGGSVAVLNGKTSSLGSVKPSSSGPAQATGGADGQVPVSVTTWIAGISIGFLGMFIGVYL
jgi:hypothetical protein